MAVLVMAGVEVSGKLVVGKAHMCGGARVRGTEAGEHKASRIVKRCKVENGWCKTRTF